MKPFALFLLVILLSTDVLAGKGSFGVEVDVSTSGLFPPRLDSAVVATVQPESPAAKANVKPGDKIISINGCKIPGCSAWKAKKHMKKKTGESASFTIVKTSGEEISVDLVAE